MNELKIFEHPKFGQIRTITENGVTLFCGGDITNALAYKNPRKALADHCRCVTKRDVPHPQSQEKTIEMNFIPEGDIYRLVAQSELPGAREFESWIFDEVLPSIRKHGAYMTPDTIRKLLADPDTIIQLATALKEEQGKRKELEAVNSALTVDKQIMQPKADYFDELVERNTLTNFREAAKELDVPPKKFVSSLIERKYIYRDRKGKLQPYQQYVETGLFVVKECCNEKTQWSGSQTLITPKGRETFRLLHLGAD